MIHMESGALVAVVSGPGERLAGIENLSVLSEWPIGFGSQGWDLRR